MRSIKSIRWISFVLITTVLAACKPQDIEHSRLFDQIFLFKGATFRGTNLGDAINVPKESEPLPPKYEDSLGITYEIDLKNARRMFIEYYKDNKRTQTNTNRVAAIVANVLLEDELVTADLYNEIHDYFNSRDEYGLSRGTYGNYQWDSQTQYSSRMEIILKLNDNKKGLTLNFIDTRIDYNEIPE